MPMLCASMNGLDLAIIAVIAWVTFGQAWTGFSFRLHVNLAIVLGTLAFVPAGRASATWYEMNRASVTLPLVREGNVVRVTVPSVSAWNAG
mgnify:CR=1 FL=1